MLITKKNYCCNQNKFKITGYFADGLQDSGYTGFCIVCKKPWEIHDLTVKELVKN